MGRSWKSDTITPLIIEEKDPKEVRSYRPEALTNILCLILEKREKNRRQTIWLQIDEISKITTKI